MIITTAYAYVNECCPRHCMLNDAYSMHLRMTIFRSSYMVHSQTDGCQLMKQSGMIKLVKYS